MLYLPCTLEEFLLLRIAWRRKWQPTPVFLLGESHGRRSLGGYSPQGCKESDTTERLHFHFHCFPQLLSTASDSCEVNHLPLIVFDKYCREKFCILNESDLIKRALQVGSSREPPDKSNNSLGIRL